ncbi:MAG: hypothetical protein LBG49_02435 [Mycoplasmataceae bacterium]|jgi:hypothetical protein|nr:hypothetical protein [Mycoplasmataceae bacterium]
MLGQKKQVLNENVKLMLFSLITIVFVVIRLVLDICSFISNIGGKWSPVTWTIASSMLLVFNISALVFTILEYRHSKDQHRVMLLFVIIILCFTLILQGVWWFLDLTRAIDSSIVYSDELLQDFTVLIVIAIACDLVAIPIDIISTYLISKKIKK